MMLFGIRDLTRVHGRRKVLDIHQLDIQPGRVYALMGPNGAGKTTLMEILAFLDRPTSGQLEYMGRPVESFPSTTQLRRQVVMVPQTPILFTTSVLKNVEYGLRVRGVGREERRRAAETMLDRVGMGAFAPARADRLSGGETQRVAMARALACAPQVILLDEPTANVDVENHAAIEGIIQDMRKSGTSVILTTHDAGQAARLADERIHLFEGRVTEDPLGNVLTIQIVQQNGGFVGRLADGLEMPLDRGPERTARVSLNPRLLTLVAWEPQDSKPSGWDGRVVELASEGNDVRLKVDVGRPFSVLWPRDRFQTQPLGLGDRVRLSAPPQALEFLS